MWLWWLVVVVNAHRLHCCWVRECACLCVHHAVCLQMHQAGSQRYILTMFRHTVLKLSRRHKMVKNINNNSHNCNTPSTAYARNKNEEVWNVTCRHAFAQQRLENKQIYMHIDCTAPIPTHTCTVYWIRVYKVFNTLLLIPKRQISYVWLSAGLEYQMWGLQK